MGTDPQATQETQAAQARPAAMGPSPGSATGRRRSPARLALRLLAIVLALAVVVLGTVGWVASERAIHPAQHTYAWSLATYPDLRPQTVSFVSRTGVRITARFFAGRSHATIVLSHGYGDDQDQMLPWAAFLHRAGYSVLTYDMPSRGHSAGSAVTLGALEQQDLVSAVDYLASRRDVDKSRIGALGVSLGGSTTILAAARDARIKAIVDDCGFSDAPGVINVSFEHFVGLPAFPFAPITIKIAELRTGVDIGGVRPVDHIGAISPRAVFIIHGLADRTVPPDNSVRNFAAAGRPKQIWWVPGARHAASLTVAHDEYVRRVVAFFRRYVGA